MSEKDLQSQVDRFFELGIPFNDEQGSSVADNGSLMPPGSPIKESIWRHQALSSPVVPDTLERSSIFTVNHRSLSVPSPYKSVSVAMSTSHRGGESSILSSVGPSPGHMGAHQGLTSGRSDGASSGAMPTLSARRRGGGGRLVIRNGEAQPSLSGQAAQKTVKVEESYAQRQEHDILRIQIIALQENLEKERMKSRREKKRNRRAALKRKTASSKYAEKLADDGEMRVVLHPLASAMSGSSGKSASLFPSSELASRRYTPEQQSRRRATNSDGDLSLPTVRGASAQRVSSNNGQVRPNASHVKLGIIVSKGKKQKRQRNSDTMAQEPMDLEEERKIRQDLDAINDRLCRKLNDLSNVQSLKSAPRSGRRSVHAGVKIQSGPSNPVAHHATSLRPSAGILGGGKRPRFMQARAIDIRRSHAGGVSTNVASSNGTAGAPHASRKRLLEDQVNRNAKAAFIRRSVPAATPHLPPPGPSRGRRGHRSGRAR